MKQRNLSWTKPIDDNDIDDFISSVEDYIEYLEDYDPPNLTLLEEKIEDLESDINSAKDEIDDLSCDVLHHARAISSSLEKLDDHLGNIPEKDVNEFYKTVRYHIRQIASLVS